VWRERIASAHRSGVMTAATLAVAVTVMTALPPYLLGGLSVQVQADLGFDEFALGIAVAAYYLVSALGSVSAGRLVQRRGPWWGIVVAAGIVALALLGVGVFAHTFAVLSALMVLGACGNAFAQPAANLGIARVVRAPRRALLFGVKQASVPAASLVAGAAVPAVALTVGWRWAFVLAGLAAAAIIPLARAQPTPPPDGPEPRQAGVLGSRALAALSVSAALAAGGANSFAIFLVQYSVARGMAEASAGWLLLVAGGVGVCSRVVTGWRADVRGEHHFRTVAAMQVVGALGAFTLGMAHDEAVIVVAALVAFAFGWGWNGLFSYAVVHHSAHAASATGVTQAGVYGGTVVGPVLFGAAVRYGSYAVAWSIVAVMLLLGAGVLVAVISRLSKGRRNPYR